MEPCGGGRGKGDGFGATGALGWEEVGAGWDGGVVSTSPPLGWTAASTLLAGGSWDGDGMGMDGVGMRWRWGGG